MLGSWQGFQEFCGRCHTLETAHCPSIWSRAYVNLGVHCVPERWWVGDGALQFRHKSGQASPLAAQ
jgi:hypothetical protein